MFRLTAFFSLLIAWSTLGANSGPVATDASDTGMVLIPGGEFTMGVSTEKTSNGLCCAFFLYDQKPAHKVHVNSFYMDICPVTNRQFQAFVDATGYVTTAEKAPLLEDIMSQRPPGSACPPKELLVPGAIVFIKPDQKISVHDNRKWWKWTPGARWKHPLGPNSTIVGIEDHPVVQVSWFDAMEYAKWANKRLPTEAEWEYAAHGGKNTRYTWGDEEFNEQKPQANIWHGEFPHISTKPNGYYGTTRVKTFAANPYGLYDMAGNVWQWCYDLYSDSYYEQKAKEGISINPKGPLRCSDPSEPYATKRVNRGGSFLCHASYCKGYEITARMKTSQDTSLNHLGFRCVKDVHTNTAP